MFTRLERWLAPRLMVCGAVLSLVLVTALVPQVHNVLLELPGLASFSTVPGALWVLAFYAFVISCAAFVLAGGWLVAPLAPLDEATLAVLPAPAFGAARAVHAALRALDALVSLPLTLAQRPGRRGVVAILAMGAVLALGPVLVSLATDRWPLHDAGRRFFTFLALGWCVTLVVRRRTDAIAAVMAARFATMSIGSYLVGEGIWLIVPLHDALSFRLYTIWAIFHLYFVVVAIARALDQPKRTSMRVALSAATAAALVISWSTFDRDDRIATEQLPSPQLADPTSTTGDDDLDRWLERVDERLQDMPPGPALIVANAGGGSRAAIFATLVLESLQRTDLAGEVAAATSDQPRMVDRVLMLSGVSGGSLASAYHVHTSYLGRPVDETTADLKNAPRADLQRALEQYGWRADRGGPPWPLVSRDVDAMFTDFTAPVLRGIVLAGSGRGRELSKFWDERFGWRRRAEDAADRPTPPLLLLNTARISSGERVIIGEPPVPALLTRDDGSVDDSAALSVCTLCGAGRSVALADAVRLSANFPWVVDIPYLAAPGAAEKHTLIDGGAFDNTGLDALSAVFARMRELSDQHAGTPTPATARVRRVLQALADRGVVVVEVDSGAKPARPGLVVDLLSPLLSPLSAVGFAAHAFARQTSVLQVNRLRESLSGVGEVTGLRVQLVRYVYATEADQIGGELDARCLGREHEPLVENSSIMTAWSLGPSDKADLLHIFLCQEADRRRQIKVKVEDLAARDGLRHVDDELGRRLAEALLAADADIEQLPGLRPFEQRAQRAVALDDAGARAHRGWIFLGRKQHGAWQARVTLNDGAVLPQEIEQLVGRTVTPTSWSYAWDAVPDGDGKLGAPLLAMSPDYSVAVDAVEDWEGTGLVFAHVGGAAPDAARPAPPAPPDAAPSVPPMQRDVQQLLLPIAAQASPATVPSMRIDVFACAHVAGARSEAEAVARRLVDGGFSRRKVDVRVLSARQHARPGHRVRGREVRYQRDEQAAAEAARAAAGPGFALRLDDADPTPGYLAVLVCP